MLLFTVSCLKLSGLFQMRATSEPEAATLLVDLYENVSHIVLWAMLGRDVTNGLVKIPSSDSIIQS